MLQKNGQVLYFQHGNDEVLALKFINQFNLNSQLCHIADINIYVILQDIHILFRIFLHNFQYLT